MLKSQNLLEYKYKVKNKERTSSMNKKESIIFYLMFIIGFVLMIADSNSIIDLVAVKLLGLALMVSSGYLLHINQY